jgi:hypothetical protein
MNADGGHSFAALRRDEGISNLRFEISKLCGGAHRAPLQPHPSSFSFGVVLAWMWFAEKLTVMFSAEGTGDERDEAEIQEKKRSKMRVFLKAET